MKKLSELEAAIQLISELRANQHDLELQNEELRRLQAERKQAEDALRESEFKYRTILQTTAEGFWITDRTGRILEVNQAHCNMAGYTRDEFLGITIADINAGEDPETTKNQIASLMQNGTNTFEKLLRRKDGTFINVEIYAMLLPGGDGEMIGFCRNITERKRAEAALLEKDEKIRYITENSSDIVWSMDSDLRFDYISPANERILGYKRDEVMGTTLWDSLNPDGIEQVKRAYAQRLDDEQNGTPEGTTRQEVEQRCKDGSWIWMEVNVTANHDENGTLIGFYGVSRDINQRKRAETALVSSQARYRALVDQSFEALALLDIQSQEFVEVNCKFTELLGYSLPEDAPLHNYQVEVDPPQDIDRYFNELLKSQKALLPETRVFRHKNGSKVYAERAGTVISLDGRNYLLVSLRDMTAERRRQSDLIRDVEFARRVQRELLPALTKSPLVDICTIYHPSNIVSGDSYYMKWRNEGELLRGFLIDITGHGLATALQTASISALLRETSITDLTLMEQIHQINLRAEKYFSEGSYASMLGFELDFTTMELRYAGAGITQFYFNGTKIMTPGMLVGMWENAEFESGAIPMSEGDTFYFLTDGFTDKLSQPELANFWSQDGKDFDADVAALEQLAEKGELLDDATGLCFRINGMNR